MFPLALPLHDLIAINNILPLEANAIKYKHKNTSKRALLARLYEATYSIPRLAWSLASLLTPAQPNK
jgi:hypothetical protein